MPAPNEITPQQLNRLIGRADAPIIIDVCLNEDFAEFPFLVPSAQRFHHHATEDMARAIGDRKAVIICQKGKKLSQGVAAILRESGISAEYLQGGIHGWRELQDAPMVKAQAVPERRDGATLWVTRARPKIDRIACPWLIRRFVDPNARFLFVNPGEVEGVVANFAATPFDVADAHFGHREGLCTFDVMLDEFGLHTNALVRLAKLVRAADLGQHDQSAEAPGLLAISVGLSKQYKDDNMQLEAGLNLYDALYLWARDGQNETHDQNSGH